MPGRKAEHNSFTQYDADLTMFNDQFYDICHMLSELDERGVHTVEGFEKVKHPKFELYQDKSGGFPSAGESVQLGGLSNTDNSTLQIYNGDVLMRKK